MIPLKNQIVIILAFFYFASSGLAAEGFDYPELMVTPSASETLKRLAEESAKSSAAFRHLNLQLQSLGTLAGSFIFDGSRGTGNTLDDRKTGQIGLIVGGGWLIGTTLLGVLHDPYKNGWTEVQAMPSQNKRQQLAKERRAEEVLKNAYTLANRLRWISTLSHVAANALMAGDTLTGTQEGVMMASAAAAVMLFFWKNSMEENYLQHLEYKKKIYGPVASLGLSQLSTSGKSQLLPSLQVHFRF